MAEVRDEQGRFQGHEPNEGCDHRTTGDRAWCSACGEWCYPHCPCLRCERALREDVDVPALAHWLWSETWDGEWGTQWDGPGADYVQSKFEQLARGVVHKLGLDQ